MPNFNLRLFALLLPAALAVGAQASITSYSNFGQGATYQRTFDPTLPGYVVPREIYGYGEPVAFSDPYVSNWVGGDFMATQGIFNSGITSASSTYIEVNAYFSGHAETYSPSSVEPIAEAYGYDQLSFSLDQAGTLTLEAFFTAGGGYANHYERTYLWLDGTTYWSAPGSAFFSIPIAPGGHHAYVDTVAEAYGTEGISNMTASLRITVSSVPEPCTMLLVGGIGLAGLLRRRRA